MSHKTLIINNIIPGSNPGSSTKFSANPCNSMNCGDFLIYQNAVKSRFTQGVNWTNRGTFRLKF